jgi:pimeloyl-ACP methyl ester carboxylesterase
MAVLGVLAASAHAAAEEAPEFRHMDIDSVRLPYVEEGSGDAVVFVHGNIADLRIWEAYRAPIAEDRRFVAYSQRYFGTGEWPDAGERYSRETHIGDLIAFIEGLEAGPVHVVSWSYGGEIATYAALQRPELFRSMVHYEPDVAAILSDVPGAEAAARDMFSHFGPAITALEEDQVEKAALSFIDAVFQLSPGTAGNEPEPWPTYWRENARTIPHLVAMAPPPPLDCGDLQELQVPTLIVVGDQTFVRFAMMADRLAACQGNALLVPMAEVGHDGPYRRPDEFARLIGSFLDLVE